MEKNPSVQIDSDLFEGFLEDPSWADCVAIPAAFVSEDMHPQTPPEGDEGSRERLIMPVELLTAPFKVPAYVFPLSGDAEVKKTALAALLDRIRETHQIEDFRATPASIDGSATVVPFVTPAKGRTHLVHSYKGLDPTHDERCDVMWQLYRQLFGRFSASTGLKMHVHLDGPVVRSQETDIEGEVHVFVGKTPTGTYGSRWVRTLCGIPLDKTGGEAEASGPTYGRGTVFGDDRDEPAAQVLGNNWFLLLPRMNGIAGQVFSHIVLERVLSIAWDGWRSLQTEPEAGKPTCSAEEYAKAISDVLAEGPGMLEAEIKAIDANLDTIRQAMGELYRKRLKLSVLIDSVWKSQALVDAAMRVTTDHVALSAMPELEKFWVDEHRGLIVITKPLPCSDDDGTRYGVGSYGIRVNADGVVGIWCEQPARADGIPHPHLPKDGTACLGNAGEAITQAAAEFRYAATVRYVLDWLMFGYSSDLTREAISDWPLWLDEPEPVTEARGAEASEQEEEAADATIAP